MNAQVANANEYRDLPLSLLAESETNPRRFFDESSLKELAETIRSQGLLSPLLVRPKDEASFEIVFGARRYRAAQMAEVAAVPVRIKYMTDAEVLEAQLIENLQRRDVHSMEEAEGYKRLLSFTEPTYTVEQIAAKVGKTPVYITTRLKLTDLCDTVCANPECPVHHPKGKSKPHHVADNAKWKAEQDKQRREEAVSNTTGIRVLAAIGDAVPVRLMKRDLLFVVERLAGMLDENRLAILAKQHGLKKAKDSDSITKLFAAFLRRAEESVLGRLAVELTIVFAASRGNAPAVLKEAAAVYKVDTDAIAAKVRQEFVAKENAKSAKKAPAKAAPAKLKKTA